MVAVVGHVVRFSVPRSSRVPRLAERLWPTCTPGCGHRLCVWVSLALWLPEECSLLCGLETADYLKIAVYKPPGPF